MTSLQRLARDIIERFACSCYTEDMPYDGSGLSPECDCGGDGRIVGGDMGVEEGCFVCQAKAALAEVPYV